MRVWRKLILLPVLTDSVVVLEADRFGKLQKAAAGIRRRVLAYTLKNNGGYLSQACSAAEILSALYLGLMNLEPVEAPLMPSDFCGVPGSGNDRYRRGDCFNGRKGPSFDRFFLSPTHYSLVLYAALVEAGRLAAAGLEQFNQNGSSVEMIGAEHSPGMEVMTGSLGQGISQAGGIAHARKLKGETGRTWIFMSDGELQPGQVWEALQAMAFYGLDRAVVIIDVNGQQCDGRTDDVMRIEPLEARFSAFGWRVVRIDGHDLRALFGATDRFADGRPLAVICDTCPWQGIPELREKFPKLHYIRFGNENEKKAYSGILATFPQRQES